MKHGPDRKLKVLETLPFEWGCFGIYEALYYSTSKIHYIVHYAWSNPYIRS